MFVQRIAVALVTAADGSCTAYTPDPVTGVVLGIVYTKNNFDNASTMTVTSEATLQPIWAESNVNASAVRYPRVGVHDGVGVAATLDGTRLMRDAVPVANERLKVVVASGGNVKSGTLTFLIG